MSQWRCSKWANRTYPAAPRSNRALGTISALASIELLCYSKLTDNQIAAVRDGEAEFALAVRGNVIFFLYRFGDAISWADAPYSYHLVPSALRQLPEAMLTAARARTEGCG